jgi:drug efflux transport system permease protein
MMDLSVQQPVFQPSTPTTNGHKAKIALFVLLMGMTGLALVVARLVFHVPFRGSLVLLIVACACCVLTGIGIGTFVSTLARSATQAQLMLFFVNPPLMALSGSFTPIEAMPKWIQPFTQLDPIARFAALARSVMVLGRGWTWSTCRSACWC